jgi:hypothetical protein
MKFYRKVLIVIIVLLFLYIIWNFFRKRVKRTESFTESFTSDPAAVSEVTSITNSNPVKLSSLSTNFADQPLRQYVIKGSYNSAVSGNYVSTDMIKYVLTRGCRFLDFEIFLIPDDKGKPVPQVAYSTDSTFNTIETNNSILLDDALTSVVTNAFAQPSPNGSDPLFINLRIKSTDPSLYNLVATSIDFHLKTSLYKGQVTNNTKMSTLMGKTILLMDKTVNRSYESDSKCKIASSNAGKCYDLTKYINMESGGDNLFLQKYSDLLNQNTLQINILDKCDRCTDIANMRLVVPDDTQSNPTIDPFIKDFGAQIVPNRFYKLDTGLKKYEIMFDTNKCAIIPLAYAILYINKLNS